MIMTMRLLNELLPKSDAVDIDVLIGESFHESLKGRRFAILEYFCDNHYCDCAGTKINIIEINEKNDYIGAPIALIDYDWSKTRHIIKLSPEIEQSVLAKDFLQFYKRLVKDPQYSERLGFKNKLFKAQRELVRLKNSKKESPNNKVGRNEFCFCGSGKKYKRCCIGKSNEFVPTSLMVDHG